MFSSLDPILKPYIRAFRLRLGEMGEHDLDAIYGHFAELTPAETADLFQGLSTPWWICGGWAIEAFTGQSRPHEDIDVSVLESDLETTITHFSKNLHPWAVGSGMLQPLLETTELPEWAGQVWLRESAYEPWLIDIVVSPQHHGNWVFKRDRSIHMPVDEATWVASDGIRYERPEITLAYKAKHARPKDELDLGATVPLLSDAARDWLKTTLRQIHPGHQWLDIL